MSSLAAARADNFYYPPGWDPSKGSLNKYNGSHGALGSRANKLDQGILVVRFEMPFPVWCGGCGHLIGKGVRFNAQKRCVGSYHSTKIWSFSLRTPCCSHEVEVRTDPQNREFVVERGGRRKVSASDAPPAGMVVLGEDEGVEAGETVRDRARYPHPRSPTRGGRPRPRRLADLDAATRLEREREDAARAEAARRELTELRRVSDATREDDYAANAALRRRMRGQRRERATLDRQGRELGLSDSVRLLPQSRRDALEAASVRFGRPVGGRSTRPSASSSATALPRMRATGRRRDPRLPTDLRLGLSDPGGVGPKSGR